MDRTQKSVSVYLAISSDWTWDERTVAQYEAQKATLEAQLDISAQKNADMLEKRGILDAALDTLARNTTTGVGLARVKWRNDPTKKSILKDLTARGDSRATIRDEARAWQKAWEKLDPAWVPVPGLTLTAFTAARLAIEGNDTVQPPVKGFADHYSDTVAALRDSEETLNGLFADAEETNQAWYRAATIVFAAGTPNGDLVRGQVPTTYDPAHEPTPLPGKPINVIAGPGAQPGEAEVAWLPVTFGSYYQATLVDQNGITLQPPEQVTTNAFHLTGQPSGSTITITIVAGNASGQGPASDPVSVTVP